MKKYAAVILTLMMIPACAGADGITQALKIGAKEISRVAAEQEAVTRAAAAAGESVNGATKTLTPAGKTAKAIEKTNGSTNKTTHGFDRKGYRAVPPQTIKAAAQKALPNNAAAVKEKFLTQQQMFNAIISERRTEFSDFLKRNDYSITDQAVRDFADQTIATSAPDLFQFNSDFRAKSHSAVKFVYRAVRTRQKDLPAALTELVKYGYQKSYVAPDMKYAATYLTGDLGGADASEPAVWLIYKIPAENTGSNYNYDVYWDEAEKDFVLSDPRLPAGTQIYRWDPFILNWTEYPSNIPADVSRQKIVYDLKIDRPPENLPLRDDLYDIYAPALKYMKDKNFVIFTQDRSAENIIKTKLSGRGVKIITAKTNGEALALAKANKMNLLITDSPSAAKAVSDGSERTIPVVGYYKLPQNKEVRNGETPLDIAGYEGRTYTPYMWWTNTADNEILYKDGWTNFINVNDDDMSLALAKILYKEQ